MLHSCRVEKKPERQNSGHPKESRLVVKGGDSRCAMQLREALEVLPTQYVDPEQVLKSARP